MSWLCRSRLGLAVGLTLVILTGVQGADDPPKDKDPTPPKQDIKVTKASVTFQSVDYVDLKGTLWTPSPSKKNACVLLVHNFSRKGGGNRNEDGWAALAEELAKEGYFVLNFDFRGHGDSTSVSKEFWKYPQNQPLLPRGKVIMKADDYPTKIDYKDFPNTGSYYLHLVDDIAAAKAFLDSKTGGAAGNTIIIGAGEGATLGALWLNSEYRRYRERTENGIGRINPEPEPEGKDIAAAVWLTISDTIDRKPQSAFNSWLEEVGGKKVAIPMPMLFMYGKEDPGRAKAIARIALSNMIPSYAMMEDKPGQNKDKNHPFTRDWAVDTKLDGSQLLQKGLTTNAVIKAYLNDVMEARGSRESKRHDPEKFRFFWTLKTMTTPYIAKDVGEQYMKPIPVTQFNAR